VSGQRDIRLLLAGVDGTLVKVLTEAAKEVARELHHAGIILAITSGRPPRGMSVLIEPLALTGRSPASTAACSPSRSYPSSKATLSTPP
jgi:hydroxymethylpyrimidine pyrophosphatase-like HAD family hydrolase